MFQYHPYSKQNQSKRTQGIVYAKPPKTRPHITSLRTVLYSFARVLQCSMPSENTDLTCGVWERSCSRASGNRCHFVIVINAFFVWRAGFIWVVVTAHGGEEKASSSQQHEAPAEVERQVVGVHPVVNPAWRQQNKC